MNNYRASLILIALGPLVGFQWSCRSTPTQHHSRQVVTIDSRDKTSEPDSAESSKADSQQSVLKVAYAESSPSVALSESQTSKSNEQTSDDRGIITASAIEPPPAPPAVDIPSGDITPVGELATSLTFDQAMFAGLQNHPSIGAAVESIRQSQGEYLQSTLLPNPTLFADIQMLPFGRGFTSTRQGGPPQQDVFVTYPIDWFLFGKRTASMAANQYAIHVSQAEYQDLVRTRVEIVSTAFFDLVEARALLEVAKSNVENLQQLQETTKESVDGGKRPAVELNRVKLDVLNAQQDQRQAQANVVIAEASLRAVTGLGEDAGHLVANWSLTTPLQSELLSTPEAIEIAERSRPDLEALRWEVTRSGADVVVQQRAARPTVAPSFGWTHQYQNFLGQPDADSWNANVTMSVPVFDRNQGRIAKAQAAQRQSQWDVQSRILEVRAEVQQAVATLHAADDNARAVADEQLELAEKVRDSIIDAYNLGGRPLIDVLDAQRNYRETYRLFVTTRTTYWKSLYRYRAAIGQQVVQHD